MLKALPKLIMFDLDGTLADTVNELHEAVIYALKSLNLPLIDISKTRSYVGNGADLLVARSITQDETITMDTVDLSLQKRARALFNEFYKEHLDCSKSLYPNVIETLELIHSLGIKSAVVTNKPNSFVKPLLKVSGLEELFDFSLGSEVIPYKKPRPEPLLDVCKNLGIESNEAVMVGDSNNDIEAAHNANIVSIGLTYGYNRGKPIYDSKPDYVFSEFKQIGDLLRSLIKQK